MPPDHPRGRGLAAPEVLPPPTLIGLPPTSELIETPVVGQTFSGSDFSLNGKFVSKGLQPRLLKGEDEALFDFLFEEQWTCKLVTVLSIYKTSVVYKLYLDKDMDLDESREVQSHVNLTFYPKDRWPLKKKKKKKT